jgi:hypothetical protein
LFESFFWPAFQKKPRLKTILLAVLPDNRIASYASEACILDPRSIACLECNRNVSSDYSATGAALRSRLFVVKKNRCRVESLLRNCSRTQNRVPLHSEQFLARHPCNLDYDYVA